MDVEGAPVPFRVVGLDDPVPMKLAARREKDFLDLAALAWTHPELALDDAELERLAVVARREASSAPDAVPAGAAAATTEDPGFGWWQRFRSWL